MSCRVKRFKLIAVDPKSLRDLLQEAQKRKRKKKRLMNLIVYWVCTSKRKRHINSPNKTATM